MSSNKLIVLLNALSKQERSRLRKFLCSPYFNERTDIVELFDALREHSCTSEKTLNAPHKRAIWEKLYPNRPYDDLSLRRLFSDLNQLAQRFLVAEMRRQNPINEAIDLLDALDRFDLPKHTAAAERHLDQQLEALPGKCAEYYSLWHRRYWNALKRASKQVVTPDFPSKLADTDFYLESFYLIQKLKMYIDWLLYRGLRAGECQLLMVPGFWEHLDNPRFDQVPLIRIFQKIILCLSYPEEEAHFDQLLCRLREQGHQLSRTDQRECFFIAQNYCALKINQGNVQYYYRYFELIREMADRGLLLENGQLPEPVFKNFITVSLGAGQYAWTEQFICEYAPYLPERIRENARTFNLAYVYFYQKDYDRVLECLRDVEYSDVVYALGAKSILVRTYYEMGEIQALDSLIDSFRAFLLRNKVLSKNLKREYINFVNLVRKLTMLDPSDKKTLARLRQRVSQTSYTMPKNWLMRQLAEIEAGRRRY